MKHIVIVPHTQLEVFIPFQIWAYSTSSLFLLFIGWKWLMVLNFDIVVVMCWYAWSSHLDFVYFVAKQKAENVCSSSK